MTDNLIIHIDQQIDRLQEARAVLAGPAPAQYRPYTHQRAIQTGFASKPKNVAAAELTAIINRDDKNSVLPKRRTISAAARQRMATAQQKRWAKVRTAAKKTVQAAKKVGV